MSELKSTAHALLALGCLLSGFGCGRDSAGGSAADSCSPGSALRCTCPDQRPAVQMCGPNGAYLPCNCVDPNAPGNAPISQPIAAGSGTGTARGGVASTGPAGSAAPVTPVGTIPPGMTPSGMFPPGNQPGMTPGMTPPATPPAGGAAGMIPPAQSGAGGAAMSAGGASGGGDEVEQARQACLDSINMYRATKMLTPLKRASAAIETCSDTGAKKDGDSGQAHGSAGSCKGMNAQNTCPGWPVGGFGGLATLTAALNMCLQQMWDEGEPPVSRTECQADYQGCFVKHGHYLNMSQPDFGTVACGFYKMMDGKSWWMNQDFGR